jgi:hypothetical protein
MSKGEVIDILSLVHFIIYLCLGIIVKNEYQFALMIGIVWEIFEYFVTNYKYTRELLIKYWPINLKYWEEKNRLNKVFDIMFNMMGYHIGNQIYI